APVKNEIPRTTKRFCGMKMLSASDTLVTWPGSHNRIAAAAIKADRINHVQLAIWSRDRLYALRPLIRTPKLAPVICTPKARNVRKLPASTSEKTTAARRLSLKQPTQGTPTTAITRNAKLTANSACGFLRSVMAITLASLLL